MNPKGAKVYYGEQLAGILKKGQKGYSFVYNKNYLEYPQAQPISINFPLTQKEYESDKLFPFFKGLLPEGWLLEINARSLNVDPNNDFEILLATGSDCVGKVSISPEDPK